MKQISIARLGTLVMVMTTLAACGESPTAPQSARHAPSLRAAAHRQSITPQNEMTDPDDAVASRGGYLVATGRH